MDLQRTVVLLKPDALQRDLLGDIIHRFEKKGLKIVALKLIQLDGDVLDEHYAHQMDKPFYAALKDYMMHAPVCAMALDGIEAVNEVRKIVGSTNPLDADAGTIRADFSMNINANIVHASDNVENAAIEVKRFFDDSELFEYAKITDSYVQ